MESTVSQPNQPNQPSQSSQTSQPSQLSKPLRLSHSTLETFMRCPREFQMTREVMHIRTEQTDETGVCINPDLMFGVAVGIGIQELIKTGNLEHAIFKGLMEFDTKYQKEGKTRDTLINVIEQVHELWDWNRYQFLAQEYGVRIWLDRELDHYYCGYLDLLVWDREKEEKVPVEIKTTGMDRWFTEALYKNSTQTLGYCAALGLKKRYINVIAHVGKASRVDIEILDVKKTSFDTYDWMLSLHLRYLQILEMRELKFFPKHATACIRYGRNICEHLDSCHNANEFQESILKERDTDRWDLETEFESLLNQIPRTL